MSAERKPADDDFIVYRPWPADVIRAELDVFKSEMYGGAGPEELRAGLLALDFLTRASEMDDTLRMFVDAAQSEAEMRIDLMVQREAQTLSRAEILDQAIRSVRHLDRSLRRIQSLIEGAAIEAREFPEVVHERIERRNAIAKGAASHG